MRQIIKKNREVVDYLIIGGLTTVVSYVSYAIVSRVIGLDFKVSTILSWLCAVIFAFFANKIIVFKSKTESKNQFILEIFNFFKYRILSLVIDMVLMIVLVDFLNINDLIAKFFVQFIIVAINYIFSKFFIFNKRDNNKNNFFEKEDLKYYGVVGFCLLFLFGIFFYDHLAPDTLVLYNEGYLGNGRVYFTNGRRVMYGLLWLMDYLNVSFIIFKQISWLMGISSLFFGIIVLFKISKKYTSNNWLNIIASFMVVANVFVVEFFYFAEFTGVMCFGILMTILSASYILSYIENKDKMNFFKALICSTVAMFSYQGVMAYVVIIPVLCSFKYIKNFKEFIKNNIIIFINYLIPCLLGLLWSNVVGATRIKGEIIITKSIEKIFRHTLYLVGVTQEELPKFLYLFLIAIIGVSLIIMIIKQNKKERNSKLLYLIYSSLIIAFVPLLPFIIMSTDSIGINGRSAIALGAVIGFLFMFYLTTLKNNKYFNKGIIVCFIGIILLTSYSYQKIAINTIIINKMDDIEAKRIVEMIKDYQNNNNIAIKKVGYQYDKHPIVVYPGTEYINAMTVRSMHIDWSAVNYLSYYLDQDLDLTTVTENVKEYCLTRDWDDFNKEQIIFDNDQIYICVY